MEIPKFKKSKKRSKSAEIPTPQTTLAHYNHFRMGSKWRCLFGWHRRHHVGYLNGGGVFPATGHLVYQCQDCGLVTLEDRSGIPKVNLGYYPPIEAVKGQVVLTATIDVMP